MAPVYPIELLAATDHAHYKHMAKRDLEVWHRFLTAHAADFIAFSYDVALGGTILDIPDMPEPDRLGWQYSTALKIDVVGWKGNQVWVIEVRPEATVGTFGAAVAYAMVFKRENITVLPIIPAIVCDAIQPDVLWACGQAGVQVFQVPQ